MVKPRVFVVAGLLEALLAVLLAPPAAAAAAATSIAFYYGTAPPVDELRHFARVVVEPDHLDAEERGVLVRAGVEIYAYLSAGEYDRERDGDGPIDEAWFLGKDTRWHSRVADPLARGWREFVVARAARLAGRGFPNFFLDTLDSPLAIEDGRGVARAKALAELVRAIHTRLPRARLLVNRAFAILPELGGIVAGVVAESLFRSFDPGGDGGGHYGVVSEADSRWLLEQLRAVRTREHLAVTVIDYLPPADREGARRDAARIAALGFAPWVTDGALATLGIGALEVQPRHLVVLGSDERRRAIAAAIAPLGYLVEEPGPEGAAANPPLAGRVAAILDARGGTGDDSGDTAQDAWLARQRDAGTLVVRAADLPPLAPLPLPLGRDAVETRVVEAAHFTVARRADGSIELRGLGGVDAVALPPALGPLDRARCRHLQRTRPGDSRRYARLTGVEPAILAFEKTGAAESAAVSKGGVREGEHERAANRRARPERP